jgi:hypothetical protein
MKRFVAYPARYAEALKVAVLRRGWEDVASLATEIIYLLERKCFSSFPYLHRLNINRQVKKSLSG